MFHEYIWYISYHTILKIKFWLLICIAKNLIWTTLKIIFSIFWFFCILRFQIYKYLYLSQILSYHNKPTVQWCKNLNFENEPVWLVLWSRVTYYFTVIAIYNINKGSVKNEIIFVNDSLIITICVFKSA